MPPVLDPSKSKVDGLAFIGLSLAQKSERGHPDSETHQTAFDLNLVIDRDYEHIMSTNDDGWLVGGGEPGPPVSYKLAAKDSAHVELMRIGTYRKDWGGLPKEEFVNVMRSGEILIPQIEVVPTAVVANPDKPPELEIRFDMEPGAPNFDDADASLPLNWQLRFIHNQLFKKFEFPSRFCPGAFHSTILRKAEFRSEENRAKYFEKCDAVVKVWKALGPQPLNTVRRGVDCKPLGPRREPQQLTHEHERPRPPSPEELLAKKDNSHESKEKEEKPPKQQHDDGCNSGLWLFDDRENITHFFEPNFLPPYNTPSKRMIILDVLREEWDEKTLSWKPCGQGGMTKKTEEPTPESAPTPAETPPEPTAEKPEEPSTVVAPAEEKTSSSPVNEEEKKTEEEDKTKTPTVKEASPTAEEEKTTTVQEEETITSPNTIEATLDGVVGDMLNNIRLCCSPASATTNKKTSSAPLTTGAADAEETKVA